MVCAAIAAAAVIVTAGIAAGAYTRAVEAAERDPEAEAQQARINQCFNHAEERLAKCEKGEASEADCMAEYLDTVERCEELGK
jgi:hypothetical protein